jgi:pyruvate/2-oxoglutarate dehydrogenase complex dihydrolipoamide acyltransferase (E2) component
MASGEYSTAWFQPDTEHPQPQTYVTKYLADVIERGIPRQPEGLTLGSIFDKVADTLARDGKPVPRSHASDDAARYVFARNPAVPAAHQHMRAEALARTASALRAPLVNHLQPASGPLHQATNAYITPLVRKLADEHGVDLISIKGTGVGGRIRKQDVIAAANANSATSRLVDQSETPSPETSEGAIVGPLLLIAGVIAGIIFLSKILSSTPPDDAPELSTTHVGDCAASRSSDSSESNFESSYKEVPCWYRSAHYRVLKISAPDYKGATTSGDAERKVCQDVSGWDAGNAVQVSNCSSGTLIYCLAYKPWLGG